MAAPDGAHEARKRRPKGSANPYQRKDGRWHGRYHDRYGRRQSVYGDTKAEAERLLVAARKATNDGLPVAPDRLTVKQWISRWLEGVDVTDLAPNSQAQYRSMAENHLIPRLGRLKLRELTAHDVSTMLAGMKRAGRAPATIKSARGVLVAALASAERADLISRNVARAAKGPSVPKKAAPVKDAEDALAILKAVMPDRLAPLFRFLLGSARRIGEALALQWPAVDLKGGEYAVLGTLHRKGGQSTIGPTKSAASRRSYPITDIARSALLDQQALQRRERFQAGPDWQATGYVFTTPTGEPLSADRVREALYRRLEAAGLPHVTPHGLRHAFATLARAEGADLAAIQSLLGHASISTTSLYAHPTDKADRATAGRVDKALGPG